MREVLSSLHIVACIVPAYKLLFWLCQMLASIKLFSHMKRAKVKKDISLKQTYRSVTDYAIPLRLTDKICY